MVHGHSEGKIARLAVSPAQPLTCSASFSRHRDRLSAAELKRHKAAQARSPPLPLTADVNRVPDGRHIALGSCCPENGTAGDATPAVLNPQT